VEHDPTDIALETATREEFAKQASLARQTSIGDLKWVMSNKRGRRFVHGLLEQAGVFRLSFTPGDPHATSFNEGLRNSGLRVLVQLHEHAPESYALMLSDHHAARSSD
jgi:hypothetical protein